MRALAILIACFGLAVPARAADVVELKNGDRLSGTVGKLEGGKLVFTTTYAKDVTIDWAEVASLHTDGEHLLRLGPTEMLTGRLVQTPEGIYVESDRMRSARPIRLDEITSIEVPPVRWTGSVGLLLSGTKGNSDYFSLGASAEAIRESDDDRLRFGARTDNQQRDNTTTVQSTRGWASYEYQFTPEWFGRTALTLEHDRFKDLNLRTVVSAGPGYRFIHTPTTLLSGYVGLAYVNENLRSTADRDYVSLVLGDEYRWKITETQSIYQLLDVYPNLEDTNDVLTHAEVGFRQAVTRGLFVDFGLADEYDTKPAPGRKKNDFTYLTQLGYQF